LRRVGVRWGLGERDLAKLSQEGNGIGLLRGWNGVRMERRAGARTHLPSASPVRPVVDSYQSMSTHQPGVLKLVGFLAWFVFPILIRDMPVPLRNDESHAAAPASSSFSFEGSSRNRSAAATKKTPGPVVFFRSLEEVLGRVLDAGTIGEPSARRVLWSAAWRETKGSGVGREFLLGECGPFLSLSPSGPCV
jgi:hypothetical protein